MLEDYDREIQDTSASISRKISMLKNAEKGKGLINEIKTELEQCRTSVRNMELELRSLDPGSKNKWQERVNRYKSDLKTLQRDFDRDKEVAQRNELFPGARDTANLTTTDEQARLILTAEQDRKNTDILRDSQKELHGTEKQAMEISNELVQQRSKIGRIRDNLGEGNTILGRVGRVLGRMGRRQALMSVLWCFIIIIILAVIGIIIYFKVGKKKIIIDFIFGITKQNKKKTAKSMFRSFSFQSNCCGFCFCFFSRGLIPFVFVWVLCVCVQEGKFFFGTHR